MIAGSGLNGMLTTGAHVKVGDLVKLGNWYTGKPKIGIVVDESGGHDRFFLICWGSYLDWEDEEEIVALL